MAIRRRKPKGPKKVPYRLIEPESGAGRALYPLMNRLITEFHDDLREARIALAWHAGWKRNVDGQQKLGQCKKASELDRELKPFDFVIVLNRAFFEVMSEGDARGRVMTFPIPTINLTPDFDWENPNLAGLWEMTGRYGVPYFSNFINSDMKPEDARSMCCRLRIDNTQLEKRGGGLFGAHPLTGSVGVVTVNLPRLGYLARRDVAADLPFSARETAFRERLARLMDVARDSLELKRKLLERLTGAGLYPYTSYYLRNMHARFGAYWKNHFSTIGLVGMNEACVNLGLPGIASPEGHAFATRTLDFMRERLVRYQKETGNHYNLEATPAEGTSYRLAKKDKEHYPDILAANEEDVPSGAKPFYTNSTHLPVNQTDDLFEALDQIGRAHV